MFPLYDENPSSTRPYVTWALIAVAVGIFIWQLLGGLSEEIFDIYGEVPVYILRGERLYTAFTSMFLHGDIFHIFGNMLYLFIFGDNVEDTFGHVRYFFIYFLFGVMAGITHSVVTVMFFGYDAFIPAIGASGAISGVLGAYVLFFPRARIVSIVPSFYFVRLVRVPAVFFIGFWFLLQLLLSTSTSSVAYWAHIGGFATGLFTAGTYKVAESLRD